MRRPSLLTAVTCLILTGCVGCGSTPDSSGPLTQETIREGISAEDCDDPDAALTQAEWVEFCADVAPEGPPVNERGNVVATVGEPVTVLGPDGEPLVQVTVDSITVDYVCDGDEVVRQDPANGHYLGVAMTVEAQPGLAAYQSPFGDDGFSMSGPFGSGFAVIGADGFTEDGVSGGYEAYTCSADNNNLLLETVQAGQNYRGVVVLDSANIAGTLVWQPIVLSTEEENPPAFEWAFG
jgi:hypothetical protein